jgi:hypothetical protein
MSLTYSEIRGKLPAGSLAHCDVIWMMALAFCDGGPLLAKALALSKFSKEYARSR